MMMRALQVLLMLCRKDYVARRERQRRRRRDAATPRADAITPPATRH